MATIKSPDGRVFASLTELNGGATTSFGYKIALKSNRFWSLPVQVAYFYDATRSERAYGVNPVWVGNNTLELQYWTAKKAELKKARIFMEGRWITIKMKRGIRDEAAPSGGMYYRLHHSEKDDRPRH